MSAPRSYADPPIKSHASASVAENTDQTASETDITAPKTDSASNVKVPSTSVIASEAEVNQPTNGGLPEMKTDDQTSTETSMQEEKTGPRPVVSPEPARKVEKIVDPDVDADEEVHRHFKREIISDEKKKRHKPPTEVPGAKPIYGIVDPTSVQLRPVHRADVHSNGNHIRPIHKASDSILEGANVVKPVPKPGISPPKLERARTPVKENKFEHKSEAVSTTCAEEKKIDGRKSPQGDEKKIEGSKSSREEERKIEDRKSPRLEEREIGGRNSPCVKEKKSEGWNSSPAKEQNSEGRKSPWVEEMKLRERTSPSLEEKKKIEDRKSPQPETKVDNKIIETNGIENSSSLEGSPKPDAQEEEQAAEERHKPPDKVPGAKPLYGNIDPSSVHLRPIHRELKFSDSHSREHSVECDILSDLSPTRPVGPLGRGTFGAIKEESQCLSVTKDVVDYGPIPVKSLIDSFENGKILNGKTESVERVSDDEFYVCKTSVQTRLFMEEEPTRAVMISELGIKDNGVSDDYTPSNLSRFLTEMTQASLLSTGSSNARQAKHPPPQVRKNEEDITEVERAKKELEEMIQRTYPNANLDIAPEITPTKPSWPAHPLLQQKFQSLPKPWNPDTYRPLGGDGLTTSTSKTNEGKLWHAQCALLTNVSCFSSGISRFPHKTRTLCQIFSSATDVFILNLASKNFGLKSTVLFEPIS